MEFKLCLNVTIDHNQNRFNITKLFIFFFFNFKSTLVYKIQNTGIFDETDCERAVVRFFVNQFLLKLFKFNHHGHIM